MGKIDLGKMESFLIFDGGMGTMLQNAGLSAGETPERWNIERPDDVKAVHRAYVEAGADVVSANTFGANSHKLPSDMDVESCIIAAVRLAKESGAKYVAQDIGPVGELLAPLGSLEFEDAYELFKEQVLAGEKAGTDIYIIETMTDIYEMKAALLAVKENSDKPVIASMSYQEDGRTFLGTPPEVATYTMCCLGADAVGVNCSLGPKELYPIVEKICSISTKPVIVQANAGLPRLENGETVYDIGPKEYADAVEKLLPLGVSIVGGCCGTTPDYIRELAGRLKDRKPRRLDNPVLTALTSARKMACADYGICVVGERINPTGKKKLKAALVEGRFDVVIDEAISQEELGADILGCNVGLPEIDEKDVLTRAVKEVQAVSSLPVQIDSADPAAIEAAVRIYNGIPSINSVNGKAESMEAIFPIAARYGTVVICLTLDENGIPDTAEGRFEIAKKIIKKAEEYGIDRRRLVFDCLTMTVATEQKSARETLKAVGLITNELSLHTMLGVSNISFGLPQREVLNSAFLSEALAMGLDMPILNPRSAAYMNVIDSHRVFDLEDVECRGYIERHVGAEPETKAVRVTGEKKASEGAASVGGGKEPSTVEEIKERLLKVILTGRKAESPQLVSKLLETESAMDIIEGVLIPALDEVGVRFDKGIMFLPQLMSSAETVKAGFDIIRNSMGSRREDSGENRKIILATVKGDIHDIGKNIVGMLLENYGYEVIDLGRDVDPSVVVETLKETKAKLLGLSALMTTTAKYMADTICEVRAAGLDTKVIVGGAVVTPEYAKEIGADYYAKDAAETARIAAEVFREA